MLSIFFKKSIKIVDRSETLSKMLTFSRCMFDCICYISQGQFAWRNVNFYKCPFLKKMSQKNWSVHVLFITLLSWEAQLTMYDILPTVSMGGPDI